MYSITRSLVHFTLCTVVIEALGGVDCRLDIDSAESNPVYNGRLLPYDITYLDDYYRSADCYAPFDLLPSLAGLQAFSLIMSLTYSCIHVMT